MRLWPKRNDEEHVEVRRKLSEQETRTKLLERRVRRLEVEVGILKPNAHAPRPPS